MQALVRILPAVCAVSLLTSGHVRAQSAEWTVYTSVVNQTGAPVMNLTAADFVVRENGVTREILRVHRRPTRCGSPYSSTTVRKCGTT